MSEQSTIPTPHAEEGARIRAARRRAGLSHDKLVKAAGSTRSHLIRLEKGYHKAGPDLLGRIAEATGTTVEALEGSGSAADSDEEAAELMRPLMAALGPYKPALRALFAQIMGDETPPVTTT